MCPIITINTYNLYNNASEEEQTAPSAQRKKCKDTNCQHLYIL